MASEARSADHGMSLPELQELSEKVRGVAEEVGLMLIERAGDASRFMKDTHLGAVDYATETDVAAEELLKDRLAVTGMRFHGEETAGDDVLEGWCWVVDPIDGTLNWANTLPMCAVSIALCFEGRPVLGVIHTPLMNRSTYHGALGLGAFKDNQPIAVRDIDPSEAVVAYDGIRGVGSDPYLNTLRSTIGRHRLLGTTATEMALCAGGGFAAVVAPQAKFWDVAAGIALVTAAGGVALSLDGTDPKPGSGSVIAGAPRTVRALLDAFNANDR